MIVKINYQLSFNIVVVIVKHVKERIYQEKDQLF